MKLAMCVLILCRSRQSRTLKHRATRGRGLGGAEPPPGRKLEISKVFNILCQSAQSRTPKRRLKTGGSGGRRSPPQGGSLNFECVQDFVANETISNTQRRSETGHWVQHGSRDLRGWFGASVGGRGGVRKGPLSVCLEVNLLTV